MSYFDGGIAGLCYLGSRWSFVVDDAAGAFDEETDATALRDDRLRNPERQPTEKRLGPLTLKRKWREMGQKGGREGGGWYIKEKRDDRLRHA